MIRFVVWAAALLSSFLITSCGCDDIGCFGPVDIEVSRELLTEGATVTIASDERVIECPSWDADPHVGGDAFDECEVIVQGETVNYILSERFAAVSIEIRDESDTIIRQVETELRYEEGFSNACNEECHRIARVIVE